MVLFHRLDIHFHLKKPPAIRYRTTAAVARPASLVLSTMAYIGQKQPADIERGFHAGARHLSAKTSLEPREQCTLRAFDAALSALAGAAPNVKREIIGALAACVAADGRITVKEQEIFRATAAALSLPVTPILGTAGEE